MNINDNSSVPVFGEITCFEERLAEYIEQVLQLEGVACKDWLTNKVDRSVTGHVALQQTTGEIQLPLNNLGIVTLDYTGYRGVANAIGHAPAAAIINPAAGSILAIAEALTNIIWAPLQGHIKGVSLSANWMWPCKNPGEDSRLYTAVKAASDFAVELEINIPTGKDSLSMTQQYPDGKVVIAPGTVIISSAAEVTDIRKSVTPAIKQEMNSEILYIDLSQSPYSLGGSSFSQIINLLGNSTPTVNDPQYFKRAFNAVQLLIEEDKIIAGHDISAGGMITALLEMTFTSNTLGLNIDLSEITENDIIKVLFSENPGLILQVNDPVGVTNFLDKYKIKSIAIGKVTDKRLLKLRKGSNDWTFQLDKLRDIWFKTSWLFDSLQCSNNLASERFNNYKNQPLYYSFKEHFTGTYDSLALNPNRRSPSGIKAAIIREKGVNGDREMAYAMYLAGMDVKDVHMTDLIAGRETLEEIQMIVFVGGFSNSDVLGSAKGWAGAFLFNEKAKYTLDNFYKRNDTLSLGVCNGCQLMIELGLVTPEHKQKPVMSVNDSHKLESAFINVNIPENNSVMLSSLSGSRLGIWVANGEGKFNFPYNENKYHVAMKYSYEQYPGNPNGSDYSIAGICSEDGRHLAIMPHLERSVFPWNWAYYPQNMKFQQVTPWIEPFVNAMKWMKNRTKNQEPGTKT